IGDQLEAAASAEASADAELWGERARRDKRRRRPPCCGIGFLGDSRRSSKPEVRRRKVSLRCAPKSVRRWCRVESQNQIMKADLIQAASEVITNQQILVNMVSRRVRQLSLGHRTLVQYTPALREAD